MKLTEWIKSSLVDEVEAASDYAIMREEVAESDKLTEVEKVLMAGLLFSIEKDEKGHRVLLTLMQEALISKGLME